MAVAFQYVPREGSSVTCDGCGAHVSHVHPDPFNEGVSLCDACVNEADAEALALLVLLAMVSATDAPMVVN